MKVAPIVLIGMGLTPLLIWSIAFGVIYAVYRCRMKDVKCDQRRQQQQRLLWRNVKVMTVVWAVVGCTVTVGMLLRTLSNALIYQRKYYSIRIAFLAGQTGGHRFSLFYFC